MGSENTSTATESAGAGMTWRQALLPAVGIFLGVLIYRLIAHAAGWQEHSVGESLLFAGFIALFVAATTFLWAQWRSHRA